MPQNPNKQYELASKLVDEFQYKEAFKHYEEIALNVNNSPELRADSYTQMGQLIECFDPGLSPDDDESGLPYYKMALAIQILLASEAKTNNLPQLLQLHRKYKQNVANINIH